MKSTKFDSFPYMFGLVFEMAFDWVPKKLTVSADEIQVTDVGARLLCQENNTKMVLFPSETNCFWNKPIRDSVYYFVYRCNQCKYVIIIKKPCYSDFDEELEN